MSSKESRQILFSSGAHDYSAGRFLPDEVLGHIFTFLGIGDLGGCARVCHSWSKLVWYWQTELNLQKVRDHVDDKLIRWLHARCKQLRSINLTRCFLITDVSLSLLSTIPTLTSINADYCNRITDNGLLMLASMNQLKDLSIACSTKLNSASIRPLARLPLNSLSLSGFRALDSGIFIVLSDIPTLQHLDLSDIPPECVASNIEGLISLAESLFSLNLSRSQVKNSHLPVLATLTRLQHLDLSENESLTHVGIESLTTLTDLETLSFRNCHKISDAGLLYLGHLTRLVSLDLSRCSSLQDGALIYLQHLKHLKSLDLTGCQLGDEAVSAISNLTALEKLILWNCQVTDDGLNHLVWLKRLSYLDLSNCYAISNRGLSILAKQAQLEQLILTGLNQINEFGIKHLIALPRLYHLNLSWCSSISDVAISYVIQISTLKTLDVSSCRGVTNVSTPLFEAAPQIEQLHLTNCTNFPARHMVAKSGLTKGKLIYV